MARHPLGRNVLRPVLVAALLLGLVPAAPAAPADLVERAADGQISISGRGHGHGRGMSQWGAQGAASTGMGFEAILGFYYPKASLQRGADRSIRVKLTAEDSDLVIGADASVRVTDRATGVTLNWTGLGPQARVRLAPDGYLRIQYLAGSTWTDAQNPSWPDAKVAGPVVISGPESLWVSTADGSQRSYRGSLTMGRSGSTTQVVNTLGLEEYLYGVVPRESPSWFYPAALRAQAVAARSYASGACSGGDPNFTFSTPRRARFTGGERCAATAGRPRWRPPRRRSTTPAVSC